MRGVRSDIGQAMGHAAMATDATPEESEEEACGDKECQWMRALA